MWRRDWDAASLTSSRCCWPTTPLGGARSTILLSQGPSEPLKPVPIPQQLPPHRRAAAQKSTYHYAFCIIHWAPKGLGLPIREMKSLAYLTFKFLPISNSEGRTSCPGTTDPWTTWAWTVWVHLDVSIFFNKYLYCFPPEVGSLKMQREDFLHWSKPFYSGHLRSLQFGTHGGSWNQSRVDAKGQVLEEPKFICRFSTVWESGSAPLTPYAVQG